MSESHPMADEIKRHHGSLGFDFYVQIYRLLTHDRRFQRNLLDDCFFAEKYIYSKFNLISQIMFPRVPLRFIVFHPTQDVPLNRLAIYTYAFISKLRLILFL